MALIKKRYKNYPNTNFKTVMNFYDIQKLIGRGSHGKVYQAVHKLTGKYVAIKCIEKITVNYDQST